MVGITEYEFRGRVAQFLRDHRMPGESRLDLFLRHIPTFKPRANEWFGCADTSYGEVVAQRLAVMTSRRGIEEITDAIDRVNFPELHKRHAIEAPQMYIGRFAAQQRGISQLHPHMDIPFVVDSPLDRVLYEELFDASIFSALFNEADLRRQGLFRDVMRTGKYAAEGVACSHAADTVHDEVRFHWQMISPNLKDLVGVYEEGDQPAHSGYTQATRAITADLARRRQAGDRRKFRSGSEPADRTESPAPLPRKPQERDDPDWIAQRDAYLGNKDKKPYRKW